MQIFLVDDDLDDQEIFVMALEEIDKNVEYSLANDGVDALEKLESDPTFLPDYIFIDVNMPRLNGLECLRQIRKLTHLDHAVVIIYSTTLDQRLINNSKELGANHFLVKPPGFTPLKEKLTEILKPQHKH